MRFQAAHPFPGFQFDLSHRRFGVGCPPFFHAGDDRIKERLALVWLVLLHLLSSGFLLAVLLVVSLFFPGLASPYAKK